MRRSIVVFAFAISLISSLGAQVRYLPEDSVIFQRFLKYSAQSDCSIVHTARFFIGTPYVGGTLEGDTKEQLRVNLRQLDCVTFVENVAALHLMLHSNDHTFANFCRILQRIRYRNGIIDGYLSRLHYTSEWLDNNRQKGTINLPEIAGCQNFIPNVSFMSTHCDAYPALKAHPDWCNGMSDIEKRINELKLCYIPKEQVKASGSSIQTGDMIAITTYIKGLDIAHTGFALVQDGQVYLLHASSEVKRVVISNETLHDYLAHRKNHSGIIVARLIEEGANK